MNNRAWHLFSHSKSRRNFPIQHDKTFSVLCTFFLLWHKKNYLAWKKYSNGHFLFMPWKRNRSNIEKSRVNWKKKLSSMWFSWWNVFYVGRNCCWGWKKVLKALNAILSEIFPSSASFQCFTIHVIFILMNVYQRYFPIYLISHVPIPPSIFH